MENTEKLNKKIEKKFDKKTEKKFDKKIDKKTESEVEKNDKRYDKSEYFVNRELSWLEFNKRVLGEARDKEVKLFERLKFLSITASNLDEFFMVRVASLKDMIAADYNKTDISGMTAKEQLDAILEKTHEFVDVQYSTYNRSLIPALSKVGLRIVSRHEDLAESEKEYLDKYFKDFIYPVLSPMAVDASRPFPLIKNKSLNIAAFIRRKDSQSYIAEIGAAKDRKPKKKDEVYKGYTGEGYDFAVVQIPAVLPRLIEIPKEYSTDASAKKSIILLEELVERNISSLFLSFDVIEAYQFRIMRNAEFEIDEEDTEDLLAEIKKQLKQRQRGDAIRLEIEDGMDEALLNLLKNELSLSDDEIFRIRGPIDLRVLMNIYNLSGFEQCKLAKHIPQPVPELMNEDDIFSNIKKSDILLSHPYQSFQAVIDFINAAADDEDVLAIKQTLYRVSGNSPIISALERAAENGKHVSVLVELKARFDEENNINWARRLEKAGCHVIYGLVGLKTHSKITLVLRKEEEGICRYVHLGTGNYNDSTAKLYTDLAMFTARKEYGEDATALFNMLSGYSEPLSWHRLIVAPLWMKDKFLAKIAKAARIASEGREASIVAKMNSLSDKDIIKALYAASSAGVKIRLIVRGICCLRVGIKNISENIDVHSIVGDFLEHARIFYFDFDGDREYYLGSADWMSRNLDKRVEVVFPVLDEKLRLSLDDYLNAQLADNVKAYIYMPDNSYEKPDLRGKIKFCAKDYFIDKARKMLADIEKDVKDSRLFIPKGM